MKPAFNEPGAVALFAPAYSCLCARCGHMWTATCDRVECIEANSNRRGRLSCNHAEGCTPPPRCAGCKALHWERPALYTKGEGTSRESIRRRKVARASKRGK